jgi:hypothetical protein
LSEDDAAGGLPECVGVHHVRGGDENGCPGSRNRPAKTSLFGGPALAPPKWVCSRKGGHHDVSSARCLGRSFDSCPERYTGARGRKGKEPDAILEIGGSGNWNLSDPSSFGPTAAIEFTPIENWLEIEVGTGPMFGKGIREWDTDILFKKPFTLSDKVEFMIGAGPQWGSAFGGSTKAGVEIASDFMFWPSSDRKLGWFLEPSYNYNLIGGHEQSLGVSVGLLIPIYAK